MASPTPASQPRPAHHMYAHRGLPHTFLGNPPGIMAILASPDALEFLSGMWGVVEAELPESDHIGCLGLSIDVFPLAGEAHAAIVTMPPPQREFEAFFVALVAKLEGQDAFARVFSLVLTSPPVAQPQAALLEWNAKGEHTFIEERAEPSPGAFAEAIDRVLATPQRA